jgi:protein gp37
LPALDWVIAGGETGAGARPTDPDWLRDLRDRCRTAVVPFFFKQWGEWAPAPDDQPTQKMARRGRRAAGRLIDGRSWDELPAAMRQASRKPR